MSDNVDLLDIPALFALDRKLVLLKGLDTGAEWRAARRATGTVPTLRRFLKAKLGPGRLFWREYLYYRLWDGTVPEAELPRFVGIRMRSKQTALCNDPAWKGRTTDKVAWDAILRADGLPVPDTFAVFGTSRPAQGVAEVADRDGLIALLRDPARYPMIAKPNLMGRSLGLMLLERLEGDIAVLRGGARRSVEQIAAFIEEMRTGYLFQKVLVSDPTLGAVTGGGLCSLRVLVLMTPGGPAIENIVLKIPRKDVAADNFWRGNMMGAVDDAGRVMRVVADSGAAHRVLAAHPETGATFGGLRLPGFPALGPLVDAAARLFPGVTMQGWDVALTDRGAVPIEVNFGGDVNLQQLAHGKGALTPAYCAHLRRMGWTRRLPD